MSAVGKYQSSLPPYTALPAGGANGWWYVADSNGRNCLVFPDKPGAKFTTQERAKQIADQWNTETTKG